MSDDAPQAPLTQKQERVLRSLRKLCDSGEKSSYEAYEIAHEAEVDNRAMGSVLSSLLRKGLVSSLYDDVARANRWIARVR